MVIVYLVIVYVCGDLLDICAIGVCVCVCVCVCVSESRL